MRRSSRWHAVVLCTLGSPIVVAQQPPEFGAITWQRNYATARAAAARANKPVLLLFQEVPGWSTCVDFGAHVLSHPLLVEAAETLFVAVAIKNNTEGDPDAEVLAHFREKTWNNPVVRFLDADERQLAPRLHDDWTLAALAGGMVNALTAKKHAVPEWLTLLAHEEQARRRGLERAVFSQAWFWVGEAEFGLLDGVHGTRAGWLDEHEVTEVWFDPKALPFAALLAHGIRADCAQNVWTTTPAQLEAARAEIGNRAQALTAEPRADKEPKYYLLQTPYRHVPMTAAQAARCNAALAPDAAGRPERWLSPRQLALLADIQRRNERQWPIAVDVPMLEAWRKLPD